MNERTNKINADMKKLADIIYDLKSELTVRYISNVLVEHREYNRYKITFSGENIGYFELPILGNSNEGFYIYCNGYDIEFNKDVMLEIINTKPFFNTLLKFKQFV